MNGGSIMGKNNKPKKALYYKGLIVLFGNIKYHVTVIIFVNNSFSDWFGQNGRACSNKI